MSDSTVKCTTCGKEKRVRFAKCLHRGWPLHCGATMGLISYPELDEVEEATKEVLNGETPHG